MINETKHSIIFSEAADLSDLNDNSVSLVVTSPPYPMIEMWDESFGEQNPEISNALQRNKPHHAFELMHQLLGISYKSWGVNL